MSHPSITMATMEEHTETCENADGFVELCAKCLQAFEEWAEYQEIRSMGDTMQVK